MRVVSVVVAVACMAVSITRPAVAQVRSASAIGVGSVVRLRHQSPAACRDSGNVVAVERDSAIVEMPVARVAGNGAVDCSLFSRRAVRVAELDVWRGPTYGGRHGIFWGVLLGPPAGAVIGLMADSRSQRKSGSFALAAGGVIGFFLGPVVGGIVGAIRGSNEWIPAASPATP